MPNDAKEGCETNREVRWRLQASEHLTVVVLGLQPTKTLLREPADAAEGNQLPVCPLGDGCTQRVNVSRRHERRSAGAAST